MSFIDRLKNAARALTSSERRLEREAKQALYQYRLGVNSAVPIPDNPNAYIQQAFDRNAFVYTAIMYVARNAATLPVYLCKKDLNGDEIRIEESLAWDLWNQANSRQTGVEHRQQQMAYLLTTGNTYGWVLYSSARQGEAMKIETLPAQYTEIIHGSDMVVSAYQLNDTKQRKFDANEVMHTKLTTLAWGNGSNLYGQSPWKAGGKTVSASNQNVDARTSQAANRGANGMIVPIMSNDQMELEMSDTSMRNLESRIQKKINGNENAGRVTVSKFPWEYLDFGMSSQEMQLIEESQMSKQDIAGLVGISSIVIGDMDNSSFNNYKTAETASYKNGIIPYFELYLAQYNRCVTSTQEEGAEFKIDYAKIPELQPDMESQVNWMAKAHWMSNQDKQKATPNAQVDESFPKYSVPANLIDPEEGNDDF